MRRKIPSSQNLLSFEAVARHQSLTRAALELSLTQSAVSRQINALEEYLGVKLFKRARHGVTLTAVGTEYAARVARRLSAMEQDTLDIMGGAQPGGDIHLASVPTFAAKWLIPRLPAFAAKHPGITVHIETRTRPFMFADAQVDAALYAGTPEQLRQWAGTQSVHLLDELVLPVCHPQLMEKRRTLTAEAIAQLPLLQQSTRPDAWAQWLLQNGIDTAKALAGPRYEQFSMSAAAAAQGMGVALVPRLLIEAELARGELVIANPTPLANQRAYYLVRPDTAEAQPQAVEWLVEWLVGEAKA